MDQQYQLTYISQAVVLFLLEEHPFFSEASTTSWPFPMRATYGPSILLIAEYTFSPIGIFVGLAQQSK